MIKPIQIFSYSNFKEGLKSIDQTANLNSKNKYLLFSFLLSIFFILTYELHKNKNIQTLKQ